ncbi:hypothetical protein LSAT2_016408 [Lamellibrachia satsuma]|nr:hypothetical protein LSAT2_016408 [Lamellibrachia satsuma]
MHVLTFLLLVCGATNALATSFCSREYADSVIASSIQAFGIGGNIDVKFAIKKMSGFFQKLVEEFPDLRVPLAGVNVDDMTSPEFGAHGLRVATGMELYV